MMFQNFFKIAWRSLLKNKVYSAINVFGLAIGITTCTLITLYVMDEISYDKHHVNGERIYRVASEVQGEKWVAAPGPLAAGLKREFPEVETMKENVDVSFANIDNDYIKTLGIRLLQGRGFSNAFTADSNALILNEVAIKKLGYDVNNAVGKKIYSDFHDRKITMTIIGVVKDYHY